MHIQSYWLILFYLGQFQKYLGYIWANLEDKKLTVQTNTDILELEKGHIWDKFNNIVDKYGHIWDIYCCNVEKYCHTMYLYGNIGDKHSHIDNIFGNIWDNLLI